MLKKKNQHDLKVSPIALFAGIAMFCSPAVAGGPLEVSNGNDTGEGSLRAALEVASAATLPVQIVVSTDDDITIDTPLVYAGQQPLILLGHGNTIETDENITLFTVSEGADLTIHGIDFEGPGGFDIENRGGDDNGGKGIFVDVRDDQTGLLTVSLTDVAVSGVSSYGIHISDCDLADDCGAGGGGTGGGSDASISVTLKDVSVVGVGNGGFDADGLRVDERGLGSVYFVAKDSVFEEAGADGLELDEGQDGSIIAQFTDVSFIDNGNYCDPSIMDAFLPSPEEAEFDDGQTSEADIPSAVEGSLDDRCIEREVELYDSGTVQEYAFGLDLDDGIDIDEAGPGSVRMTMSASLIKGNLDEGVDLDERDDGDIVMVIKETEALENNDDGIKLTERDAGHVHSLTTFVRSERNGGKGIVLEEEDDGELRAISYRDTTIANDDGDATGFELVQEAEGSGVLTVNSSHLTDGIDSDGASVDVVK